MRLRNYRSTATLRAKFLITRSHPYSDRRHIPISKSETTTFNQNWDFFDVYFSTFHHTIFTQLESPIFERDEPTILYDFYAKNQALFFVHYFLIQHITKFYLCNLPFHLRSVKRESSPLGRDNQESGALHLI